MSSVYHFSNLHCLWSCHFELFNFAKYFGEKFVQREVPCHPAASCIAVISGSPTIQESKGQNKERPQPHHLHETSPDWSVLVLWAIVSLLSCVVWDPVLLLRTKDRLCTNASEGRIKNHHTLSEAKWVFKLANKKVMRNACSPEPPKENQQMPATIQTLSVVGSGDFKTRQGGLVGTTEENDTEITAARGSTRENHGGVFHRRQRQTHSGELPAETGQRARLLPHPPHGGSRRKISPGYCMVSLRAEQ